MDSHKQVCTFFSKIGACRHGVNCSRLHDVPETSRTVLLENLCAHQILTAIGLNCTNRKEFDKLFSAIFTEIEEKYGAIEEMNISGNKGDHLNGNVYVMFSSTRAADRAVADLNNRWFATQPIYASHSPVDDFREACCRQYELGDCSRGDYCNFIHVIPISRKLKRFLHRRRRRKSSTRSPSPMTSPRVEVDGDTFSSASSTRESSPDSHLPATYRITAQLSAKAAVGFGTLWFSANTHYNTT